MAGGGGISVMKGRWATQIERKGPYVSKKGRNVSTKRCQSCEVPRSCPAVKAPRNEDICQTKMYKTTAAVYRGKATLHSDSRDSIQLEKVSYASMIARRVVINKLLVVHRSSKPKALNGSSSVDEYPNNIRYKDAQGPSPDNCSRYSGPANHSTVEARTPSRIERAIAKFIKTGKLCLSHSALVATEASNILKALANQRLGTTKKLKLHSCHGQTGFWKTLGQSFTEKMKIPTINLRGSKNIPLAYLAAILKNADPDSVDLSGCRMDLAVLDLLANLKAKTLKLNYDAFSHPSFGTKLAQVLANGVTELHLVESNLTTEQLEDLEENLKRPIPLRSLNLSNNTLRKDGMIAVAKILNQSDQILSLSISDCDVDADGLEVFHQTIATKISRLDLSYNKGLGERGSAAIAGIVDKNKVESVDISGCKWTNEMLRSLETVEAGSFKELTISETPLIDASCCAGVAAKLGLTTLDVSECRMTLEKLQKFKASLGGHKLEVFDISDPTEKPDDAMVTAVISVSACVTRELVVRCKQLSAKNRTRLQEYETIKVFVEDEDHHCDARKS